jgi:hypothetical protein
LLKKDKNSLNKKVIIFALPYKCLVCIILCSHPLVSHL